MQKSDGLLLFLLLFFNFIPSHWTTVPGGFVVHEILACCHHHIRLQCPSSTSEDDLSNSLDNNAAIAIISARYVLERGPNTQNSHAELQDFPDYYPTYDSNTISLWDMDVKFASEFMAKGPELYPDLNTPEWMRIDNSDFTYIANHKLNFRSKSKLEKEKSLQNFESSAGHREGLNFTQDLNDRQIHLPLYNDTDYLDKGTVWKSPLFRLSQGVLAGNEREKLKSPCISYSSLNYGPERNIGMRRKKSGRESTTTAAEFKNIFQKKPQWDYKDLRKIFNHRCSGKSQCDVNLLWNTQKDQDLTCHKWPDGKILVRFLCYNLNLGLKSKFSRSPILSSHATIHKETTAIHHLWGGDKCGQEFVAAKEGFISNPGYPQFYPGDSECRTQLQVPQGQKILLLILDISLRGEEKSKCTDEIRVDDSGKNLLSTCGDYKSAVAILSYSNSMNITLKPKSRMAYPKRGFLAYFRVIGCRTPIKPGDSHLTFRNATHAFFTCELGHLYPDTLQRGKWLTCNPLEHSWTQSPDCQDIRDLKDRNSTISDILSDNPELWPIVDRKSSIFTFPDIKFSGNNFEKFTAIFTAYILPTIIILLLFGINCIVLLYIKRRLSRQEELENEENLEMEAQLRHERIYDRLVYQTADDIEVSPDTFSFTSSTDWDSLIREPSAPYLFEDLDLDAQNLIDKSINDAEAISDDDEGGFLLNLKLKSGVDSPDGEQFSPKTVALMKSLANSHHGGGSPLTLLQLQENNYLNLQQQIKNGVPPPPARRASGLLPLKITSV